MSQMRGRSPASTRMGTGPTFSSSAKRSPTATPSSRRTNAVPIVGWPAKTISRAGVKIRTRATQPGRVAGRTNVVSDRLSSRASFCIVPSSMPDASVKTARALPSRGRSVNTSTTR